MTTPSTGQAESQAQSHRAYTLDEQIRCVRRELAMRQRVYPKWVMSGKMKPEAADHEINCLQAVHDTLMLLDPLAIRRAHPAGE